MTAEQVRSVSLRDSDMGDKIFDGDESHCDWCGGEFSSPAEYWLGRHFTCAAQAQQVRSQQPRGLVQAKRPAPAFGDTEPW